MLYLTFMAHFKFLLDRGVKHLAHCFPAKRVVTTEELGLPETATDGEIIEQASVNGNLLIAANRKDFARLVPAYIKKSTKKLNGCRRVYGLILIVPNEQHVQEKVLRDLEARLILDGEKITYTDVHDRDLLVQVESGGKVKVGRLPRCPHCVYGDMPDRRRTG